MQKKLLLEQSKELCTILQTRFEKNMHRHIGLNWVTIQEKLDSVPEKLWSLNEMENSGGEPDVIGFDGRTGNYRFVDCSVESPLDRRSLCYDDQALKSRKENKPRNSAVTAAATMGVELLTEEQYRQLQALEEFDTKTSSWLWTPPAMRKLGGALFGDYRFGNVFFYHNSAESYYASRGFRVLLLV